MLDFWHYRNDFDEFAQTRLVPPLAELADRAFTEVPAIEGFPVHNYTVPDDLAGTTC